MPKVASKCTLVAIVTAALLSAQSFPAYSEQPAEESPVVSVPGAMHWSTQAPSEEAYQLERLSVYRSLAGDGPEVPSNAGFRVRLLEEDRVRLRNQDDCPECRSKARRFAIGVNKIVDGAVSLTSLQVRSLSTSRQLVAGGVARKTTDGKVVWTTIVEAAGAAGLRIRFSNFHLGPNTELLLYTSGGEVFGPYGGGGPLGKGEFWSNTVAGSEAYLELRTIGPATQSDLDAAYFEIAEVGALAYDLFSTGISQPKPAEPEPRRAPNAPCIIDATCANSLPAVPTEGGGTIALDEVLRRAVALMIFADGAFQYICSGGLMNDTDASSFIPYFLTANHCISTQASATSLECVWRYRTSTCGGLYPSRFGFPRTLGSTLLATGTSSDYCFLRLSQEPPDGSFLLGWTSADYSGSNNTRLYRISHPQGSPQSFSIHSVWTSFQACSARARGPYVYSHDDTGATEGGSSGSPVVLSSGHVIGQLYGGCGSNLEDVCDSFSNATVDGNFSWTYSAVRSWINPATAANNLFGNAQALSGLGGSVSSNNSGTDKEAGEPNHAGNSGGASVWFRWTSPESGVVTVDTLGSGFDTLLAVYTGTAVSALAPVTSNDDIAYPFVVASSVTFLAASGQTYRIAVDGYNGLTGAFRLHWNRSDTTGYILLGSDGGVFSFGSSRFFGSLPALGFVPAAPLLVIKNTLTENGYYMLGRDGGIFGFGDALFRGSLPGLGIVNESVDMEVTRSGNGYYVLGRDGGIFAFGDAQFYGSLPQLGIINQALDIELTPSGQGYWILAADGGIFSFGDAPFFGSLPALGIQPNRPLRKIKATPSGGGYYLLGEDGGIFAFGDAAYRGSLPDSVLASLTAVDLEVDNAGRGYYILTVGGSVYAFGIAPRFGELSDFELVTTVVDSALNRR